jgi:hypothetical protein
VRGGEAEVSTAAGRADPHPGGRYLRRVSTVLYSYRLKRQDLWELAEALRERYLAEGAMARLLREYVPRMDEEQREQFRQRFFDPANEFVADMSRADLILYEEDPDHFLIRFSEYGWFGYESLDSELSPWARESGWAERLEQVIVDNRSDSDLARDKRNMPAADLVDDLVRARRYLLVRLLEPGDLRNLFYSLRPEEGAEPLDDKDLDWLQSGHKPVQPCPNCGSKELTAEPEHWMEIRCGGCGVARTPSGALREA